MRGSSQAPVLQLRGPGNRGQTPTQGQGSQTQTEIPTTPTQPVLRLRGASVDEETVEQSGSPGSATRRRIQWAEDVVDNEGLGRKKSKVCCIYHAPKGIDESSDESSSDSDDSDSDNGDDGSARPARKPAHGHGHNHHHDHDHDHGKGKGQGKS